MIEVRLRFVMVLVFAGLIVGGWDTIQNYWDHWTRPPVEASATLAGGMEFYCPMDPSVIRATLEPNGEIPKCPICGMPLSKRKRGDVTPLPRGVVGRLQLSPDRIRLAGVDAVEIDIRPMTREVRAVGFVTYDEKTRTSIVSRVTGYIEKLYVDQTYAEVKEGDPLAEIYSPELYTAFQELLIANRSQSQSLLATSRDRLRLLGVADREIDAALQNGVSSPRIIIRSPSQGRVIRKEVVQGSAVEVGRALFEVADLTKVWIEADIYEKDISLVLPDQPVEAAIDAIPNRVFQGKVSLVYPEVETETRTNRVRFEVDNTDHSLRPGMYATVVIKAHLQDTEPFVAKRSTLLPVSATQEERIASQRICPVTGLALGSMGDPVSAKVGDQSLLLCCSGCDSKLHARPDYFLSRIQTVSDTGVLAVPEMSVIDTGNQKIVYVERAPGLFEGIEVKLGPKSGGFYSVVEGLLPGDRVAAAGAFLIDAETRLNPAASAAYFGASDKPTSGSPNSSQRAEENTSAETSERRVLSAEELAELAQLPPTDRRLAEQQVLCPIADQPLGSMGVPQRLELDGEVVFLCCKSCEGKAKEDPKRIANKVRALRSASSGE
jgi:Cu(I)/Ag(I) efflux system membrane fusion protein